SSVPCKLTSEPLASEPTSNRGVYQGRHTNNQSSLAGQPAPRNCLDDKLRRSPRACLRGGTQENRRETDQGEYGDYRAPPCGYYLQDARRQDDAQRSRAHKGGLRILRSEAVDLFDEAQGRFDREALSLPRLQLHRPQHRLHPKSCPNALGRE